MKIRILLLPVIIAAAGFAQPDVPELKQWATDLTGTLTTQQTDHINSQLKTFEDSTSNQLVVLIIKSLDGYPIEELAYEIASRNKIGTAKNNNGVLLLIAIDDRKLRIEVGYGLEGALPDALTSSIIRNEITPHFRSGDYYAGVTAGINAIIAASAGEYTAEPTDDFTSIDDFWVFLILFIALMIIVNVIPWAKRSGGSTYYGGGGYSGGWSSGSSGGGFSGGGGSFGGGGSSGSW